MSSLFRADGQWAVFLLFLAAGALSGAWRDAVFGLCVLMETGKAAKLAAGVLAGAGAAFLAAAACFLSTGGEPRAYMLAGLGLGAALYEATLGTVFRAVSRYIVRLFRRLAAFARNSAVCKRIFR